jgi:predicted ATPase
VIEHIKITGYKSFKNLSLELKPLTIIMGPNASGKSNLIDALYLISRIVTSKNLNEAFKGHRGLPLESCFYGDEGFEKLIQKEKVSLSFELDVNLSTMIINRIEQIVKEKRKGLKNGRTDVSEPDKNIITEKRLRYHIEIEVAPQTGYLRVVDERLSAIKTDGLEKKRSSFLEKVEEHISLRMEGQAHPTYFDIGLDHSIVSEPLYEPHYPHISAFRAELAAWHTFYLEPRELMRDDVPLSEIESPGPRGENLAAFINTLKHNYPHDFRSFNLALQEILPAATSLDVKVLPEGRVGLRLNENKIEFSARLISEGTLRVIGLLAAVHPRNPTTLIAFEEPENGIHPVRLKLISEVLKNAQRYGKQIIITTHSPILPEYFKDEDLFVSIKEFGETAIKPFCSLPGMFRSGEISHALEDRILRGDLNG